MCNMNYNMCLSHISPDYLSDYVIASEIEQSPTLHSILNNYEWSYDVGAIKRFLEHDSSSINEVLDGYQPLHKVLMTRRPVCSKEVVKLLLDYGAEVNPSLNCLISHLIMALAFNVEPGVLKLLLEAGAEMNRIHNNFCSILCFSLHVHCTEEKTRLMMDFSGITTSVCKEHCSLLQCYVHGSSLLRISVIALLIRKSTDLGNRHSYGRSTLCYALHNHLCTADIVKLLLTVGPHISDCDDHFSPLLCYVEAKADFKADIVSLLLEKSTDFNHVFEDGNTLLHLVLRDCRYEVAALKVLLKEDVDVNSKNSDMSTPLICAIYNNHHYIKLDAVQLLIEKGASLSDADNKGQIPLHYAMLYPRDLSLIRMLVNYGSPMNVTDYSGRSPIENALQYRKYSIAELLLVAGAKLDICSWIGKLAGKLYEWDKDQIKCLKSLMRYAILENKLDFLNQVDCLHFQEEHIIAKLWKSFVVECFSEVQHMRFTYISPNVTLLEFASRYPYAKFSNFDAREYDFNKLLLILANKAFPLYSEIISTKVKRSYMENKFQEVVKNVVIGSYICSCIGAKSVFLNRHCTAYIASFLPDNDFLSFIISLKFRNNTSM